MPVITILIIHIPINKLMGIFENIDKGFMDVNKLVDVSDPSGFDENNLLII